MKEFKTLTEYRRFVSCALLCALVISRGGTILESDFKRAIQGGMDFVEELLAEEGEM